jgi:2'-5' RNA ligase
MLREIQEIFMLADPGTLRLFFALRPDAAAATRMHELTLHLRAACGLQARPLPVERLHLTLCFLGNHSNLSPRQRAAADAAGRTVQEAQLELTFDRVESFGRGRNVPLVLSQEMASERLCRLHDRLATDLARTGLFHMDARPFKPHVTLLYARKIVPAHPVVPISWTATQVLLVQSRIGSGHHDLLGRYPLR